MSTATDDLIFLAERVRSLYWSARANFLLAAQGLPYASGRPVANPRWDGGTDRNGRRHKPVWPKIAAFLVRAGVSPEAAVHAVFRSSAAGTSPPLPTALLGQGLIDRVAERPGKDHRQALAGVAAERVAIQSRLALLAQTTSWSDREICRDIILDDGLSLGPLMRLCLARQTAQHDLAAKLEDEAFFQYVGCPAAYDEALGGSLPGDFPQRLNGLRALPEGGL